MESWNKINDFGHWGICDDESCLYPEVYSLLEKYLKSGNDFNTGWHGFKKEIQSMKIEAVDDDIKVHVWGGMDDMPDLIYDTENGEKLTEEQMEIVEAVWDSEFWACTEQIKRGSLSRNCSVNDILSLAVKLSNEINDELEHWFQYLENVVKGVIENEDM